MPRPRRSLKRRCSLHGRHGRDFSQGRQTGPPWVRRRARGVAGRRRGGTDLARRRARPGAAAPATSRPRQHPASPAPPLERFSSEGCVRALLSLVSGRRRRRAPARPGAWIGAYSPPSSSSADASLCVCWWEAMSAASAPVSWRERRSAAVRALRSGATGVYLSRGHQR